MRASLWPAGDSAHAMACRRSSPGIDRRARSRIRQANVRGKLVQETRRISRVEPLASFENAEEYVLTRVERFILIAQKLSTASERHRSVPAAGVFNIQLLHAGCITPRSRRSVTAADFWW